MSKYNRRSAMRMAAAGAVGAAAMVGRSRYGGNKPGAIKFGYILGGENEAELERSQSPDSVLRSMTDNAREFNVYARPWTTIEHQENQGSCAGHALAMAFHVSLVHRFGVQSRFSRACAYYMAQTHSGIKGDRGATISACAAVAEKGICLEKDWEYPDKYDTKRPDGVFPKMNFKMSTSSRVKDADLAWELLRSGACIQTGVAWGAPYEHRVCDKYRGGTIGGHSTLLYGLDPKTDNAINHNSWGNGWMDGGRHQWSKNFFSEILKRDRFCVFVAYDSSKLQVPNDFVKRCFS